MASHELPPKPRATTRVMVGETKVDFVEHKCVADSGEVVTTSLLKLCARAPWVRGVAKKVDLKKRSSSRKCIFGQWFPWRTHPFAVRG